MSHFVARGPPTAAQLYLDTVLAAAAAERAARGGAGGVHQLSLGQVLHYCLKTYPQDVFMTNGATGVRTTNQQLLEMAVPLARALAAAALAGQTVVVAARDHERTVALYLACIFAGVVAFMADPVYTKLELEYFIELVEPRMIFCDGATQATVAAAARGAARVVAMHTDQLLDFSEGHSGDIADFRVPDADPRGTVLLLPTSGSTGLPQAVCYHGLGVLAQMPVPWMHHSRFPRPTERVMLLTTPQWGTFTVMVTACCAFRVELLMSPELPTVQHVLHMMDAYRPTWTFFAPSFAKDLVKVDARYFSSLQTVLTLGSPATPELFAALKEKMPAGSNVGDGFGLSELQSLIAHTHPAAQHQCSGPVANIMHYKLVKEDGTEAATNEPGELYVKGVNLIYSYYKNEAALASCLEDGWFRTGDEFTQDAAGTLYYRRRTKFSFKYNNQQVSPEEVERLIESIPYVKECVVCDSECGPVAGVVLHAGAPADSHARQAIHHAVEESLSDHKRLRGGVAIVASLAHTNNGKLKRYECRETLHQLMRDGLCQ